MKKHIKKALVLLLAAVTLMGCMAFSVSAAEVRETKTYTVSNSDLNLHLYCYLHYYYNSGNQNVLTKVASISDFAASSAAQVLTPNNEPVYLYNSADVGYATGATTRKICKSSPLYLNTTIHQGEAKMMSNPLMLNSALVTDYVLAGHGVSTYVATAHTYDSEQDSVYPASGERQLYYYTQVWQ